jgi:hypothetical protein
MPTGAHSLEASKVHYDGVKANGAEKSLQQEVSSRYNEAGMTVTAYYALLKAPLEASDTLDVYSA